MSIKLRCPHCFLKIAADEEHKGSKVNCPGCERVIHIPAPKCATGLDVGGFVIEQWLGNGAMGEVHLAKQTSMGRMIALKILPDESVEEEEDKQRFIQEVHTLAKLDHPNIVSAISAGEFSGGAYLAMNFINGVTVEDKINKEGPLGEKDAIRYCITIAEALDYAWDNGSIIHRDLKPANFMVDYKDQIHLMDMGIAKSMENDLNLTVEGMVMGTPYYMSPEQASGEKKLDMRSDIYSLGASLYHMVTGFPPYDKNTSLQVMAKKLSEPPKPAIELNPNLSKRMCKIVEKLMEIELSERPKDWSTVISLLKETPSSQKKIKVNSNVGKINSVKSSKNKKSSSILLVTIIVFSIIIIALLALR